MSKSAEGRTPGVVCAWGGGTEVIGTFTDPMFGGGTLRRKSGGGTLVARFGGGTLVLMLKPGLGDGTGTGLVDSGS